MNCGGLSSGDVPVKRGLFVCETTRAPVTTQIFMYRDTCPLPRLWLGVPHLAVRPASIEAANIN